MQMYKVKVIFPMPGTVPGTVLAQIETFSLNNKKEAKKPSRTDFWSAHRVLAGRERKRNLQKRSRKTKAERTGESGKYSPLISRLDFH